MTAVSVIVPAYESERTLGGCLAALRAQTHRDFELVVVDSSPSDGAGALVAREFPEARYVRSPVRLGSQAARNEGARRARGDLLVFTDPDIYPPEDWLARLVAESRDRDVVLGAIACHGERWLDRGAHLSKFWICLPGGPAREVPFGWSGNVAVSRQAFEALGGWDAAFVQGDTVFTDRLRRAGHVLWFVPGLVVRHDHGGLTLGEFLRERYRRGKEFAAMEADGALGEERCVEPITPASVARLALVLPLRIAGSLRRISGAARDAGLARDLLATAPLVLLGVAAWYGGIWRTAAERAFAARVAVVERR